jgi:hypothetical protein
MKFFLKSLYQTFYSVKFYREAIQRPLKSGIKVFLLFSVITGIIWGLIHAVSFVGIFSEVESSLENFPQIEVTKDGLDISNIEMPLSLVDGGTYFGLDTTGELTEIPEMYFEGILIRDKDMVFRTLEEAEDNIITYTQLLQMLERESIYMDSDTLATYIKVFAVLMICFLPIWGVIANILVLGFKVFVVTLIGAVVIGLLNKDDAFENAFKIALYISIPIYIINTLWNLFYTMFSQIEFLLTILCILGLIVWAIKWVYFWGLAYYAVYQAPIKPTLNK